MEVIFSFFGLNLMELLIVGLVSGVPLLGVAVLLFIVFGRQRPTAGNPNLVSCPDCGRRVSRLAASCPGCGQPLATPPERQ